MGPAGPLPSDKEFWEAVGAAVEKSRGEGVGLFAPGAFLAWQALALTDDQKAVCARAVDHFGRRAQLRKVAEELRELAVECDKRAEVGHTSPEELNALTEALAHERADVEIVRHQFDNMLLPSLRPAVRAKIASQIERLERRLNDGE